MVVQHLTKSLLSERDFARIIGRCRLGADIEAPHKCGFILVVCRMHAAPLYQGLKKARQPIGLMTFLYLLYMLEI